jgi:hypothetical protein
MSTTIRQLFIRSKQVQFYQRPNFHTSALCRQNYFDTFKFVERLEKEGFTTEQSEVIMNSLQKVISESMEDLTKIMVSKAEREKVSSSVSFQTK